MAESGNSRPARPKRSRRHTAAITVWVFCGVMVLAAAGWLLYYRATFHTFAWWSVPPSVSHCGRRYDQSRTVAALPPEYTYSQVMTVEPSGWPIYAQRPAGTSSPEVSGAPCAMGLALKRSNDQYVLYGLVGGP